MDKPVEILVWEFFADNIAEAVPEDVLYEVELHDTTWQKIMKPRGLRLTNSFGDMAPGPGGGMKEVDMHMQVAIYARVEGTDQSARVPAMQKVYDLERKVCEMIYGDQSLGNRVCDVLIVKCIRDYDSLDGNPYAIANIQLIINPSGSGSY